MLPVPEVTYTYDALLHRVIDGDTFDMEVDMGFGVWNRIRVRLKGIDTPEMRGKTAAEHQHAREAASFSSGFMHGKRLRLRSYKMGAFGRWEGDIWAADFRRDGEGDLWRDLAHELRMYGYEKRTDYNHGDET